MTRAEAVQVIRDFEADLDRQIWPVYCCNHHWDGQDRLSYRVSVPENDWRRFREAVATLRAAP